MDSPAGHLEIAYEHKGTYRNSWKPGTEGLFVPQHWKFSPKGNYVITDNFGCSIYDCLTGAEIEFPGRIFPVNIFAYAFNTYETLLYVKENSDKISCWNLAEKRELPINSDQLGSLNFERIPNNQGNDPQHKRNIQRKTNTLAVIDSFSQKIICTLGYPAHWPIEDACLSLDGDLFLTFSDYELNLCDVYSGKVLNSFLHHGYRNDGFWQGVYDPRIQKTIRSYRTDKTIEALKTFGVLQQFTFSTPPYQKSVFDFDTVSTSSKYFVSVSGSTVNLYNSNAGNSSSLELKPKGFEENYDLRRCLIHPNNQYVFVVGGVYNGYEEDYTDAGYACLLHIIDN